MEIKEAAQAAIAAGANQYAPGKGILALREAISVHQQRFYGLAPDPQTEIIVTTGATEAIAAALLALVGPGDEVLTFEPFYDSYGAIIGLSGATHVTAPLLAPDFMPDLAALEAAFSNRTKVVLINNPHNPTGAVFPREVLERVVELAAEVRRRHRHRRSVRAPDLRCPAHPGRDAARGGGAHADHFLGRQDVLLHRLEDRLALRAGGARGRRPDGQAVPELQFRHARSRPPSRWAWGLPDEFYAGIADTLRLQARHPQRGTARGRPRRASPRRGPTSSTWTPHRWGSPIPWSWPAGCPALVGVAAIPVPVFCHAEGAERTRSLLRFAFCKQLHVLEEAAERLATLRDRL